MNKKILNILKAIKVSDYLYAIFIVISFLGFYSNKKQRDYIYGKDENGKSTAHIIRLIILVIALLIYIYFLERSIKTKSKDKREKNKMFLQNLDIFAGIIFVIGILISIYTHIKGDEAIIITE